MNKIIYLLFAIILVSCKSNNNWEIELYKDDNNIPSSAIYVKSQKAFYVLGQKFTKTDSLKKTCSIIKLSKNGEILKESFFGEDEKRMGYIHLSPDNRIILTGANKNRLWLQEIDYNLEPVMDTIFESTKIYNLYSPKILFDNQEIILISNSRNNKVSLSKLDSNYNEIWKSQIVHKYCSSNVSSLIQFQDAIITSKGKIVVVGNGHPFKNHYDNDYHYDTFFTQLDSKTGNTEWFKSFGDGNGKYVATSLIQFKSKLYVTGMAAKPDERFNVSLYCLALNGDILWNKSFGESRTEWGNDIENIDGNIHIAGYQSQDKDGWFKDYLLLKIDEEGNLLSQKKFGSILNDEMRSLVKINDKEILLLGSTNRSTTSIRNAWHITKTTVNTIYSKYGD